MENKEAKSEIELLCDEAIAAVKATKRVDAIVLLCEIRSLAKMQREFGGRAA